MCLGHQNATGVLSGLMVQQNPTDEYGTNVTLVSHQTVFQVFLQVVEPLPLFLILVPSGEPIQSEVVPDLKQ
jgi:hypothetical protein